MADELDLITSGDAAILIGVSQRTVNRWADDGTLPIVGRLPGPIRLRLFDRVAIEEFARNRSRERNITES